MQGKQTLYKSTDLVPIRWYWWHHYENYEQLLIYTGIIPIQSLLKYTRAELASENIIKGLKGIMQDDMTCQKIKLTKKVKMYSSVFLLMVIYYTVKPVFIWHLLKREKIELSIRQRRILVASKRYLLSVLYSTCLSST